MATALTPTVQLQGARVKPFICLFGHCPNASYCPCGLVRYYRLQIQTPNYVIHIIFHNEKHCRHRNGPVLHTVTKGQIKLLLFFLQQKNWSISGAKGLFFSRYVPVSLLLFVHNKMRVFSTFESSNWLCQWGSFNGQSKTQLSLMLSFSTEQSKASPMSQNYCFFTLKCLLSVSSRKEGTTEVCTNVQKWTTSKLLIFNIKTAKKAS